jgi:RimJ/RimL family protein N-acetyltransferase
MPNWIDLNAALTGSTVDLAPLETKHFSEISNLASDPRIWEFYPFDCNDKARFAETLKAALVERERGTQFPFVILHKKDARIAGCTRFLDIQHNHRKLEIGWTWLAPSYWATAVNLECKLLLMTFAFEVLHASRIQLKTDENNKRSRKAIEKTGGKFEGVIRNDMIRDDKTMRNSAMYGIIDTEWESLKPRLIGLYHEKAGV